jgi:8-oxo-dGTP pyrophosphatase MutT (NUDIX family)
VQRPVPPQVIPRPVDWSPGGPAPWADVPAARWARIGLDRVLVALGEVGQNGPAPQDFSTEAALDQHIVVAEGAPAPLGPVNSAVLAVLYEEEDDTRIVLTRRSTALRTHRGEVSFPGGRLDQGEDPASGALREAHEEVGLASSLVTVVGWLHPVMTMVSASRILPVVATVPSRPHLVASPAEVERVFDVALAELADPRVFHEERWRLPGRAIEGSRDDSFPVWFFEVAGEMIWGATARMLQELLRIVLTGRSEG